jgi:Calcineurin-like phosphoesterase
MKQMMLSTALLAAALSFGQTAIADEHGDHQGQEKLTIAVFGDWPYNQNLLTNAPLLLKSINSDREVSLVVHVGDVHSGSMACTSAGILPPISTSNPGWNQQVFNVFEQFKMPVVYTPGDNEWTDCQKSKEFSAGDPLKELASVRTLYFAKPGKTLGFNEKKVSSQAEYFDHAHPTDAQFVENVMWQDAGVVFATVNMPGSNNDTLPWAGIFANVAAQAQEVADRTAADTRWLQAAFQGAEQIHAKAVVIALQADMFDPAAIAPGGDGLSAYTPFVRELANLSVRFGRPVLLLNGDSHLYEADHPLADPTSATGQIHHTVPVPNLTRITVQGSTNAPAEWLRLTIDPRTRDVFSWQNVAYCTNPTGSCQ